MEKFRLTVADYHVRHYPIIFVFRYEGELLDSSPIRDYFEKLVKKFPQTTGSFQNEGPHIVLATTYAPISITEAVLEQEPTIESYSSVKRIKLLQPPKLDGFNVHITKVLNPKCYFITLVLSHGICDGEGLVNVLFKCSENSITDHLKLFVKDNSWNRQDLLNLGWGLRKPRNWNDDTFVGDSFFFTNKQIQELKKLARFKNPSLKNRIVSANDVLCAHMWKISAIVREDVDLDQIITFTQVINIRKKLNIGNNYLGNAHYAVGISNLTRKNIIEFNYGKLVETLREFVELHTPETVKKCVAVLNREYDNGTLHELSSNYSFEHGFFVTNVSTLPWYENTRFGGDKSPSSLSLVTMRMLPWGNGVFPAPNGDGVEWKMTCEGKYMERIKSVGVHNAATMYCAKL